MAHEPVSEAELDAIEEGAKGWPTHVREGSLVLRLVAGLRAARAANMKTVPDTNDNLGDEEWRRCYAHREELVTPVIEPLTDVELDDDA